MKKLFHELKTYTGFYLMLIFVPILAVAIAAGILQGGYYMKQANYERELNYGYASLEAGAYAEAITAFENAYKVEPNYDTALALAKAWYGTGNAEKAVQVLNACNALYEPTEEVEELLVEYKMAMGIYPKITIGGKEIEYGSTSIFINNVTLTEEDKAKLAEFKDIVTLDLTNCGLTDIEFLRGCTKLMSVTLTENPISDFTPLYGNPDLRTLYINDTAITDFYQLHELSQLTLLNANGNWITKADDDALLAALPDCQVYTGINGYLIVDVNIKGNVYLSNQTELDLSNMGISDATPLQAFSNVRTLNLSNNRLSWITPLDKIVTVRNLDLSGNRISNISALSELRLLTALNLENNTVSDLSPLANHSRLTTLNLNGNNIYHGHEALATLSALTTLHLQDSLLKDQHLAYLPMGTLTELDIRNNSGLSEAAVLDLIANNPNCTIYNDYKDVETVETAETTETVETTDTAETSDTAETTE